MAAPSVVTTEANPSADAEGGAQLDGLLLSALANPRDRLTILKLDMELERFLRESRQTRLEFPPMSSYQRLIVHRVAHYFRLDHAVFDMDGTKRSIVLFKTPQSRIPALRFTDLIEQEEAPPTPSVKIMRRSDGTNTRGHANGAATTTAPVVAPVVLRKPEAKLAAESSGEIAASVPIRAEEAQAPLEAVSSLGKTLEEREADYARARARIFNEPPSTSDSASPPPSTPSSVASLPASVNPAQVPSPPPPGARSSPVSPSVPPNGSAALPVAAKPAADALPTPPTRRPPPQQAPPMQLKGAPPPHMPALPLPHWEGGEYGPVAVLAMDPAEASGYYGGGAPPPGSPWGDSFFYQPDPQSAFARSAFPPPLGAPQPPPVGALPRGFVPDPRVPLPYAAVAAAKGAVPKGGVPHVNGSPVVAGGVGGAPTGNARDAKSPPLPLPMAVHHPHAMHAHGVALGPEEMSVLGFYAAPPPGDKGAPPDAAMYAPMPFPGYAPLAPWPMYAAPFGAYPHPAYGPAYPTGPISASVEYERRPPVRSMELFDPKAPAQRRTASAPTSPHGIYAPPPQAYPQLYDPSAPPPQAARVQTPSPSTGRAAPSGPSSARTVRPSEKPAAVRSAQRPYYDYSQPVAAGEGVGVAAATPPPVPSHILEVFNLAPSVKADEPGDAFAEIKGAGGTVKVLGGGAVVAVFRTSAAAKAALGRVKSASYELRVWAPVVGPIGGVEQQADGGGEPRAKSPALP